MRNPRLFAALLLLLATGTMLAAQSAAPRKIASVEGITEYHLDNGLRVLLFPDQSKPKVTVNLTVLVGSRHEGYGETGMAHLLEHMVFKGTPAHQHIPRLLQERGAQFNGTTSFDRTNYFETLTASDDNLEFAIRLEADRLVNSYVKREDLISEMTVVRNEFEAGENSPTRVLMQRIMAAAYEWHNYGKSTIGNRSDIERVPIENLQAFYRKHYQPDNAVLVVAGKFDEAKALGYIQKYFGAIPRPKRKLDTTYTEEPPQDGERFVTLRRVGDVGSVGIAYHVPAGAHEDMPVIDALSNILTDQPSGRLYKALVETKKATSVFAFAWSAHDPSVLLVQAEVRRGNSLEEVRDTIFKVLDDVVTKGVTEEEVTRAKRQMENERERALSDPTQFAIMLSGWASMGDWRLYFVDRDRTQKVTAAQVQSAAARYLQRNNRTVGMFIPTEKAERVAIPKTPDVKTLVSNYKSTTTIAQGEAFDPTPANIEARVKRQQIEGLKVTLLPKKTRAEEVYASLQLRYGNEENLKELRDADGFLGQLMRRGTKTMTHLQLNDELDKLKATLGGGFGGGRGRGIAIGGDGVGSVGFFIRTKRNNLPAVLDILRQVLREPTLPAEELEILKRAQLASLEEQRTDPMALAGRMLSRQLSPYPKDDVRYSPTIDEEIQRIQAVTVDQVRRLYQEYLGAQAGELTIVGDFDAEKCRPVLSETFSGWKAAQPYARISQPVTAEATGGKQAINTPDKANACYLGGLVIPLDNKHADYPALLIGNHILGSGGLSSRLGDRVRQKEGLSYGVQSIFFASSLDKRASFNVFAICNPQNIAKVDKAISEEVARIIQEGVTDQELARAKQGYLQQQQVMRTTDMMLVFLLGRLANEGRTMTYFAELEQKIKDLTLDQVSAALRKHIDPKKLVIVTAGDFEGKAAGGGK